MATKTSAPKIDIAQVFGKKGFGAELTRLQKADAALRARDAAKGKILGTDVVRDKDIDAAKLLSTTLGGKVRPITLDDLRTFAANATKLGERFKGGITAPGVIDSSLKADRDRANEEIRTAVVSRAQGGTLFFVTNAGPDSDQLRHLVNVEFPAFKTFAAEPADSKKLASAMLAGPLKFEYSCARFKYWFRFLATKGGFCAGRLETGFPRVRNPMLTGVACKHALRVMQAVLRDPNVRVKAASMIAAAQKNDTTAQVTTAADARLMAQKQQAQSHHKKNQAESSESRALRIAATPAGKRRAFAAAKEHAARMFAEAAQSAAGQAREIENGLRKLSVAGGLTRAMRDELMASLLAAKTID